MDAITLAQEIMDGRRITRDDDLSFFLTCNLYDYVLTVHNTYSPPDICRFVRL